MNRNNAAKKIQRAFRRTKRHRVREDPISLMNIDPMQTPYYILPRGPKRVGVVMVVNRITPNVMNKLIKLENPISRYPLSKKTIAYVNRTSPGKLTTKSPRKKSPNNNNNFSGGGMGPNNFAAIRAMGPPPRLTASNLLAHMISSSSRRAPPGSGPRRPLTAAQRALAGMMALQSQGVRMRGGTTRRSSGRR